MADRNASTAFCTSDIDDVSRYERPRPISSDTSGRAGNTPTGHCIENRLAVGCVCLTAAEKRYPERGTVSMKPPLRSASALRSADRCTDGEWKTGKCRRFSIFHFPCPIRPAHFSAACVRERA